jgi:hypothetical protein
VGLTRDHYNGGPRQRRSCVHIDHVLGVHTLALSLGLPHISSNYADFSLTFRTRTFISHNPMILSPIPKNNLSRSVAVLWDVMLISDHQLPSSLLRYRAGESFKDGEMSSTDGEPGTRREKKDSTYQYIPDSCPSPPPTPPPTSYTFSPHFLSPKSQVPKVHPSRSFHRGI